jgi:hypothetical protein
MLVRIRQGRDTNLSIRVPIALSQVIADSSFCGSTIGIITVIENHQLDITEDPLDGIVVRIPGGECDPMQSELAHLAPRLTRFTRMWGVAIQHNPYLPVGIPSAHLFYEPTYRVGVFLLQKNPATPSRAYLVGQKQIKPTPCFLPALKHEPGGRSVAPTTVCFHRNRLDIEEQHYPVDGQVPPDSSDPGQDSTSAGVVAERFPRDAAK